MDDDRTTPPEVRTADRTDDQPADPTVEPTVEPAAGRAAEQTTLPFDAAVDEPIPYALTARARRAVAPQTLPGLTLLPEADDPADVAQPSLSEVVPDALDDPSDLRSARARALRHAGVDIDDIAGELGVDPIVVRAWVDDIAPVRSARRRLRAVPSRPGAATGPAPGVGDARRRAEAVFEATRSGARRAARDRVDADPAFVRGLGLVTGVAEVSPQAVVVTTRDVAVARAAVRWLTGTVELDAARLRVLLRLAPQVAADLAVHAWQEAIGVAGERIQHTRWRQAPTATSVEAIIRITDPRVAGALAGWRDALLGAFDGTVSDPGDVDVGW